MNHTVRSRFLALKQQRRQAASPNQRRAVHLKTVELLRSALRDGLLTDFEDVGFCYWNISDQFAFERDGHSVAQNHRKFLQHLHGGEPTYLFWAVNDATQRFSLEADDLGELWWSAYRSAVERNDRCTRHFLQFGAHRAALSPCPARPHTPEQLALVRTNFEKLLGDAAADPEYPFYETVYRCLLSRFETVSAQILFDSGLPWLSALSATVTDDFLTGEWQSFVTPFSKAKQASVALDSVINALIYSGHITHAAELCQAARQAGMAISPYIEKRLTLPQNVLK